MDTTGLESALASAKAAPLWVEDLPLASTEPGAERRCSLELTRGCAHARAVLLRWNDGRADLILVARRDVLDRRALLRLADGTAPEGPPADPVPAAHAAPAVPDWGLADGTGPGRRATFDVRADTRGTPRSWLTALLTTLRRYSPGQEPTVATPDGTFTAPANGTLGSLEPVPAQHPATTALSLEETRGDETRRTTYTPWPAPDFPLAFTVVREGTEVRLRCAHLTGLIAPDVARGFVRHLLHVHRQVLDAPGTDIARVTLMDTAEQAAVVGLGRPDTRSAGTPTTLHEAFRAVAAASPDAEALSDGTNRLTYRELDERSDRLAAGLRARGVRDGDRVGVCLDRSADLVVALLGVLKAGAAYVPTDPAYPAERLEHTARDAAVTLVITELTRFPEESGARAVTPAQLLTTPAQDGPPRTAASPGDPAYVIYTSGSTGRPKGVVVPHRNPVALIDATRADFGLAADDVWTLFHSSAFDFSVWEMWGALLTGGRLVVVPYHVSREPDRFRDLLLAERVTVLSQTPSAFAQLLDVDHRELGIRLVVFGGEALNPRILLPWFDQHPESVCRVVNMYGITETTVHVTQQHVTRALALSGSRSVGRPLPGWHVRVLDTEGRVVPPGVAGEICVGGAGVALGYLGQPELTARRFRTDPLGTGRLYLSGDLGRLRPDGSLEHLGRLDSQVKVRGFRIELDEIRSVLLEDPRVRAAAVVVGRHDEADAATARIDAYVVAQDPSAPDTAEIRVRAAQILPDYMVPATVTALSALPLTTNGKLDTAALPAPAPAAVPAGAPPVPRTGDEDLASRLAGIWSEVLGVPVGVEDDFFEIGGNSLYAIRIGKAMRAAGLPELRLRELYRNPTVRRAAEHLRAG
ncbi:amino acid adenylation domain-containing protein [Streptomyces violaceorubidus]